jgi:hypothetical protein
MCSTCPFFHISWYTMCRDMRKLKDYNVTDRMVKGSGE